MEVNKMDIFGLDQEKEEQDARQPEKKELTLICPYCNKNVDDVIEDLGFGLIGCNNCKKVLGVSTN